MICPNCGSDDPTPPKSDDGTTTCPRCAHRFPVDERAAAQTETERKLETGQPIAEPL
jgi:uncharacterized Zn finger protein (UPF0148 family)